MTLHDQVEVILFPIVGLAFLYTGLTRNSIELRGERGSLTGYKLLGLRLLMIAIGLSSLLAAYQTWAGYHR